MTTGHDYFEEHESADIEHSAGERRIIEKHGAGYDDAITSATATALAATYMLLDESSACGGEVSANCWNRVSANFAETRFRCLSA